MITYFLTTETVSKIHEMIDFYLTNLPYITLDIQDNEWESFFKTIYVFLKQKEMENQFYDIITAITIDTFSRSQYLASCLESKLMHHQKSYCVTLYNFMESLRMLELFHFNLFEIEQIRHEIMNQCSWGEVIDFKEYQKRKNYQSKD